MALIPPSDTEISGLIEQALKQEIEKAIEGEIEQAQTRLQGAMRAAVGSIVTRVLQNISYIRDGRDLVIRVQFAFPESKSRITG